MHYRGWFNPIVAYLKMKAWQVYPYSICQQGNTKWSRCLWFDRQGPGVSLNHRLPPNYKGSLLPSLSQSYVLHDLLEWDVALWLVGICHQDADLQLSGFWFGDRINRTGASSSGCQQVRGGMQMNFFQCMASYVVWTIITVEHT